MLQNKGFDVIQCVNDADTTIIKLAPSIAQDFSVTVFSVNTDIYPLPIHHMSTSSDINNIYLTNMTRKKGLKENALTSGRL